MVKPTFIATVLIITIVVLSLVQIVVSNSLSTSGIQLSKLQNQIQTYKKQNYTLKEKFLAHSSLNRIASEAAELGFEGQKTVITISNSLPLAVKR